MLPGTTSEEIKNELLNDPNMKEGNERFYIYPQGLSISDYNDELKEYIENVRLYCDLLNINIFCLK
jgi:hypothetical protein